MSGFQKGATYPQIKEYVQEHSGLKVSSLYISQVLGQLQHLNQIDKLFHCDGIAINH